MSRTAILALVWLLASCGTGPEAQLEQARAHLARGDYAGAADAANQGLALGAEDATAWRLELVVLESEARGGKASEALARLERLAGTWPEQVRASLYLQTAGQLKEAGDALGAIGVLDAGAKRFPQDEDIVLAIFQLKESGTPAELERLRSLGYVQ